MTIQQKSAAIGFSIGRALFSVLYLSAFLFLAAMLTTRELLTVGRLRLAVGIHAILVALLTYHSIARSQDKIDDVMRMVDRTKR